jgi:hypothetical protein
LLAVAGLPNVRICAQDLQLIRADKIISLLVPIATGYGAAAPDDHTLQTAVCAEIGGGSGGETLTRVKLADCGKSPAAELLAGLAAALGSATAAGPDEGCSFVFAEQDQVGITRWATAGQLPAAWPQSTPPGSVPRALTRPPRARPTGAP